MSEEFSYNDRYGISNHRSWLAPALFFAVVGGAWSLWAGLHHANPELRSELISFTVTSDRGISIRYSLHRSEASSPVLCTLVARDIDKAVVGQIDALVPAGEESLNVTSPIPTRSEAVTATVTQCRYK
jgi:hypothetical protein